MRNCYSDEDCKGITFEETKAFFLFLKHINDIDIAFDFYHVVGTDIDKATMKQVSDKKKALKASTLKKQGCYQ